MGARARRVQMLEDGKAEILVPLKLGRIGSVGPESELTRGGAGPPSTRSASEVSCRTSGYRTRSGLRPQTSQSSSLGRAERTSDTAANNSQQAVKD